MSEIRVSFISHLDDPGAPTAEEIASGIWLTSGDPVLRHFGVDPPQLLGPHARDFEIPGWPGGSSLVREPDEDGRPGERTVIQPEGETDP